MPLLGLGQHMFDIEPLNFQRLQRETTVKFPSISRFGQRPTRQMTGYGEDPIRISGLLYPDELGGRAEFEALRNTQARARPVTLMGWSAVISERAQVWGQVVIISITDTQTHINRAGHGRKLSFDIEVAPVDDFFSLSAGWFG